MKTTALGLLCFGALAASASAEAIAPTLKGDLVAAAGKRVHRFDDAPLANAKYFAVYYSASWCGPCRQFTPDLVRWYNTQKPKHPEFELIFVSSDNDEAAMEEYMATDKMPWPALKYSKIRTNKLLTSYAGKGIPCLVFLDSDGKVLSHSYEGENYVGPRKVLGDIEKTLGAGGEPATAATSTTGTAPQTKPAPTTKGSNFDDFFKKK